MPLVRGIAVLGALCVLLGLSACGSLDVGWDDPLGDLGFGGPQERPMEARQPQPTRVQQPRVMQTAGSPQSADETWCQQVADSDRDRAAQDGYDPASVQHRYDAAYKSCLAVRGEFASH